MTDDSRRDSNDRVAKPAAKTVADQPNAVDAHRMSMMLAKKRHMSGLMCPPMGALPIAPEAFREKR